MSQASHQGGATGVAAPPVAASNNRDCARDRASGDNARTARPSHPECRGSGSAQSRPWIRRSGSDCSASALSSPASLSLCWAP